MTNAERDEILITLVKGVNSLQITVSDILKNMATKEDLKDLKNEMLNKIDETKEELRAEMNETKEELRAEMNENKEELRTEIEESKNELRAKVVDAIKVVSQTSCERDEELKRRIIANEKDIKDIKLAIAN